MSTYAEAGAPATGVTLFGPTMALVAVTAGFFALGAYLGRNLSPGWGLIFFIIGFVVLIAMRFTVRGSGSAALPLLFIFGAALGVATGPTVAYYASADPKVVWQAAGATALTMAALGTFGYSIRRDLSALYRVALWALLGLILFGVASIFLHIPGSSLTYSILSVVIFGALVVADFQRLRLAGSVRSAPLIAASIFLDALNIFLAFLNIFSRSN